MTPLRVGFIGCGWINSQHASHLITLPEQVELVGFVDPTPAKAAAFAERYQVKRPLLYTDHHEMYTNASLDAVVIGIPPAAHTDQVTAAAEQGIHIFTEKPIALNMAKAWSMVDACERVGIVSQVGFLLRFSAVVERLKFLIDSGEAGLPGLLTARYFCNSLHSHWWRNKDISGGQVIEQAIHLVDLMHYLLGEVETVYSLQRNLFHTDVSDYTNEDASGTVFGFRSGAIGVLTASNGAVPNVWEAEFRLVAKNLTAVAPDANHAEIIHTGSDNTRETISTDRNLLALEMDDFINTILHGGQTRIPMREGARTLEMVVAAARSAESHAEEGI